jgi:energy-coupling factor transport system ATP-binding protein
MTGAPTPRLEVIDLCFRHAGQHQPILNGVNLTLEPGEAVLVAGATGSGKSTLLNCLAGISPEHTGGALQGQICYDGQDIHAWSIRQRSREMGIVLQNVETQLFTDRVWDELVFGLENWNLPPATLLPLAETSLDTFGLTALRHRSINRLSAGQKQRLLLAALLALQQPLLLLDEPFAYLDQAGIEQLLALLKQRKQQGQSILLIEHRWELARELCDQTYFVKQGHLVQGAIPELDLEIAIEAADQPATPPSLCPAATGGSAPSLQTHQLQWADYPPYPDLTLAPGDCLLLSGSNGCGKTTLLRLLVGLLKPTTGQIVLNGQTVTHWSVTRRAKSIGLVLQNPNHQLFAESVAAEVQPPGSSTQLADWLLTQLQLAPLAGRHPQGLSQGQKRRLALAAVLARQPAVCLLDEIMVGQDPTSLALMVAVLRVYIEQGGMLLVTAHDARVAPALGAQVLTLPDTEKNEERETRNGSQWISSLR